jgi:hypothetical protein
MSFWSTLGKIGSGISRGLDTAQRISDGVNQARDIYYDLKGPAMNVGNAARRIGGLASAYARRRRTYG